MLDQVLDPLMVSHFVVADGAGVLVLPCVDEVGERVVVPLELQGDLVIHIQNKILEFSKSELVPVKLERQLPLQVKRQLGQTDSVA